LPAWRTSATAARICGTTIDWSRSRATIRSSRRWRASRTTRCRSSSRTFWCACSGVNRTWTWTSERFPSSRATTCCSAATG
jgi:hypothetical protein